MRPTDAEILAAMETVRNPVMPGYAEFSAACEILARELVRRVDAGELFEVPGLEWRDMAEACGEFYEGYLCASTPLGRLWCSPVGWRGEDKLEHQWQNAPDRDAAKSAAEANYRSRLRAALRPAFAADGTREHKENA